MKSYIPRKNEIKSNWHVLDAEGQVLGRLGEPGGPIAYRQG